MAAEEGIGAQHSDAQRVTPRHNLGEGEMGNLE